MRIQTKDNRRRAMTLIEVVGILTVLAILASILVPNLIRRMDRMAGDQEHAQLKSIDEALQGSILRHHYIPAHTNWASVIAAELGADVSLVLTNGRRQPRFFLIDPALRIASNSLPYTQTSLGTHLPASPRLILLSSIGPPLTGLSSGIPANANDFNVIWNTADGVLPGVTALSGWTGTGADLKVRRIHLGSLFVRLVLSTYASPGLGRYSIDGSAQCYAPMGAGQEAWYIQNSILELDTHIGVLDSRQILIRDTSFVYNEGVWRGSLIGGAFVAGMDIGSVVDKFLAAPHNPNAVVPNNQQLTVVGAMMAYMQAYEAWADSGFSSATLKNIAKTKQADMLVAVQGLYAAPGNYPPEVPCIISP